MFWKGLRTLLVCGVFALLTVGSAWAAAPAGSLFAVPQTGIDGIERWGYMNESGKGVIECAYAAAEPFAASGVAAVYYSTGPPALFA